MTTEHTPLNVLKRAREIIDTKGWIQGEYWHRIRTASYAPFRDVKGDDVTCSCSRGGLILADNELRPSNKVYNIFEVVEHAHGILSHAIADVTNGKHRSVVGFNDDLGTTKDQVLAAFDRAVEIAEARK